METPTQNLVFLGATGAVGQQALAAAQNDPRLARATCLVRRAGVLAPHHLTSEHIIDVSDPSSYRGYLEGQSAAVCTFGVGESSKVSKAELQRVDRDLVLQFAKYCRDAGVERFSMLVAVGANAKSSIHYLRLKGELEEGLRALDFKSLGLFRPSMILTPTNRYGFSQALVLALWPHINPLLAGSWRKYRGVKVDALGRAMARFALDPNLKGTKVLEWDHIQALALT